MSLDGLSSLALEVKQLSDAGEFNGIASVSGNIDLGKDIMQPGAFTKTIAERGNKVRLMDNHKVRIGVATVTETPDGLATAGKINLEKQSGREAFSDLKFYRDHGLPMGMSIGYTPVKVDYDAKGNRLLQEVKLFEVTVTELPMNERAQVLSVKSISELVTKARLSRDKRDEFTADLAEMELKSAGELMVNVFQRSLDRLLWDADKSSDEKVAAVKSCIQQFSDSYLAYIPAYQDYLTEQYGDLKNAHAQIEQKIGRAISAANRQQMQTAHGHAKSIVDILSALCAQEADADGSKNSEGATSEPKAAADPQPEPELYHSAAQILSGLRSLIPTA
jgi:HK97 family phage prohead protease